MTSEPNNEDSPTVKAAAADVFALQIGVILIGLVGLLAFVWVVVEVLWGAFDPSSITAMGYDEVGEPIGKGDVCIHPNNEEWLPRGGDGEAWRDPSIQPERIQMGLMGTTCVLGQQGGMRCWGKSLCTYTPGLRGLRLGPPAERLEAKERSFAFGKPIHSLSIGWHKACAVTRDGKVHCWGQAQWNALGYQSSRGFQLQCNDSAIRQAWNLPSRAVAVSGEDDATCAITGNRSVPLRIK